MKKYTSVKELVDDTHCTDLSRLLYDVMSELYGLQDRVEALQRENQILRTNQTVVPPQTLFQTKSDPKPVDVSPKLSM